jgi:hypothetical protein
MQVALPTHPAQNKDGHPMCEEIGGGSRKTEEEAGARLLQRTLRLAQRQPEEPEGDRRDDPVPENAARYRPAARGASR